MDRHLSPHEIEDVILKHAGRRRLAELEGHLLGCDACLDVAEEMEADLDAFRLALSTFSKDIPLPFSNRRAAKTLPGNAALR